MTLLLEGKKKIYLASFSFFFLAKVLLKPWERGTLTSCFHMSTVKDKDLAPTPILVHRTQPTQVTHVCPLPRAGS